MIWDPNNLACVCNTYSNSVLSSVNNPSLCILDTSNAAISCSYSSGYSWDSNKVCSKCSNIPNSNGVGGYLKCGCTSGTVWSNVYPYQCVCSFKNNGINNGVNCVTCSSFATNLRSSCAICESSGGFYLSVSSMCIYCPAVISSTGAATLYGCTCVSGKVWN